MMKKTICLMAIALLTGCNEYAPAPVAKAAPAKPQTASADHPVVVELYQSQGCSSCPPANAALNTVADRADVIALSFAVTYWDKLGWKDIFASPAYTQRQYDYATALGAPNVYTPQIVLNGVRHFTGIKQGELAGKIAASSGVRGGPNISFGAGKISIGTGAGSAKVWLVRYDPRVQNVAVGSGENTGRTLPHKNIVRQLTALGDWNGKAESFDLPPTKNANWRSVILVQRGTAGAIIAAKRL